MQVELVPSTCRIRYPRSPAWGWGEVDTFTRTLSSVTRDWEKLAVAAMWSQGFCYNGAGIFTGLSFVTLVPCHLSGHSQQPWPGKIKEDWGHRFISGLGPLVWPYQISFLDESSCWPGGREIRIGGRWGRIWPAIVALGPDAAEELRIAAYFTSPWNQIMESWSLKGIP